METYWDLILAAETDTYNSQNKFAIFIYYFQVKLGPGCCILFTSGILSLFFWGHLTKQNHFTQIQHGNCRDRSRALERRLLPTCSLTWILSPSLSVCC